MSLESYVSKLNSLAFWKEFTFSNNTFQPTPGRQLELADSLVWQGDCAFIFQLKERERPTNNPDSEKSWFEKKVVRKATKQIRDSLRYLDEHSSIRVQNERGHSFEINRDEITEVVKLVIYIGGESLPIDCRMKRYHISETAGFIHLIAINDYLGILDKLRIPADIRDYFQYRENIFRSVPNNAELALDEPCLMGGFIAQEDSPNLQSKDFLRSFIQDDDKFDLNPLFRNLHDRIYGTDDPYDYYKILLEFGKAPRSVWREVKLRFVKSLNAVQSEKWSSPYRLTFPPTDCTFMVAALDPNAPVSGIKGQEFRIQGLTNLTYGAKYDAKSSKGIGILLSKLDDYIHIDWCLIDMPWEHDEHIEEMLRNSNPFLPTRERVVDSFRFDSNDYR